MQITIFNTPIITITLSILARLIVKACGWTIEGKKPGCCRYIMIGASHFSRWDFFIYMTIALKMRAPIRWIGKSSLFQGPFGFIMRYLGGVPEHKELSSKLVTKAASAFSCHNRFVLAIAPENTDSKKCEWRTEFWDIADTAKVAIVPCYIDHNRKVAGVGPTYRTTSNKVQDITNLQAFFAPCRNSVRNTHPLFTNTKTGSQTH